MKRVKFLFATLALTSLLGCASTKPPPQGPSPEEVAAMQELNRQASENPQPAPAKKPAKSRKSQP
jgi:hypothetical protein